MEIDPKFELFKLVISDYGMDDAKKYELCKEIFLSSRTSVIPITPYTIPVPGNPQDGIPLKDIGITYTSNTTTNTNPENSENPKNPEINK